MYARITKLHEGMVITATPEALDKIMTAAEEANASPQGQSFVLLKHPWTDSEFGLTFVRTMMGKENDE